MGTIFSAYDIRGHADDSLTVETAWSVGNALADWLPDDGVVVVVKSESVNDSIAHGLIEGLLLQGRDVRDAGTGDATTVVDLIKDHQAVGGALVGHDDLQNLEIITLFAGGGRVVTADDGLNDINELIESGNFTPAAQKGELVN